MAIPEDVRQFAIECQAVSAIVYAVDLDAGQWCITNPGEERCLQEVRPIAGGDADSILLTDYPDHATLTDETRIAINRADASLEVQMQPQLGVPVEPGVTACRVIEPVAVEPYQAQPVRFP